MRGSCQPTCTVRQKPLLQSCTNHKTVSKRRIHDGSQRFPGTYGAVCACKAGPPALKCPASTCSLKACRDMASVCTFVVNSALDRYRTARCDRRDPRSSRSSWSPQPEATETLVGAPSARRVELLFIVTRRYVTVIRLLVI